VVLGLHRAGNMNETALAGFATGGKYEETVVALAALSKVPISIADRLMASERPDPVLILCKAAGMGWPTVKSVIMVRPDGNAASSQGIDSAFANYGRLSASTAQRVVRFWQVRQNQ
jgi:phosphoglycolate phosphatase-like HAD superfamily hydrolase